MKATLLASAVVSLSASLGFAASEALTGIVPSGTVGYAFGGAGFAFSPNTPIAVTALGYFDGMTTNETVALWGYAGTVLGQADITFGSAHRNQSYYEAISPMLLDPGHTYFLQAYETASTEQIWLGGPVGPDYGGAFSVAADINYLGYAATTNSAGIFPGVGGAADVLLIGGNFEYVVVPEPVAMGILVLGLGLLCLGRAWRTGQRT